MRVFVRILADWTVRLCSLFEIEVSCLLKLGFSSKWSILLLLGILLDFICLDGDFLLLGESIHSEVFFLLGEFGILKSYTLLLWILPFVLFFELFFTIFVFLLLFYFHLLI